MLLHAEQQSRRRSRWEMIANDDPMVPATHTPDPSAWDDTSITASWIGHATVLINFFGMRIITDPVLSDRIGVNVGGLFTLGPRRLIAPALAFDELPSIDLILLSHAHFDHLDIATLERFDRRIPVVMAKNTADVIYNLDFNTVYELDWGQWTEIDGLRIDAMEVKHFGWRYPWEEDRSRGNWNGRSFNAYALMRNGRTIVFGGDTAYHENFAALRSKSRAVDLAIMPIGAYDPWIRNHCNPEQALAMTNQMGARSIFPIHWSTFVQSEEPTPEPMQRLRAAAGPDHRIAVEAVGQTWSLDVERDIPAGGDPSTVSVGAH